MLEWSGDFNTGTNTQERDYPFFLIGRKSRTPMFPAACCESIDLIPIPRSLLRGSSFTCPLSGLQGGRPAGSTSDSYLLRTQVQTGDCTWNVEAC